MLDEPAAGLNTGETVELMEKIHEIRDRFDLAILLIEHNMELVMGICERILVLNFGKTIAQGTAALVRKASKSRAPGSGRTWAACRAYASAWHRWSCSACSVFTGFPVSRSSALASSPPLMPTRR